MAGDFNEVTRPSERSTGTTFTPGMRAFGDWLESGHFQDLPLVGRSFTWSNSLCQSRLDRVCVQDGWMGLVTDLKLVALSKNGSDHTPILLSRDQVNWGPKPFRDLAVWWDHPGFKGLIATWWAEAGSVFPGNFSFVAKLRWLKRRLHSWNKTDFGDIHLAAQAQRSIVDHLDSVADTRPLSISESEALHNASSELQVLLKRADIIWRQKSKYKWSMLGDRNSSFFHRMAKFQTDRASVREIVAEGIVLSNPEGIKAAAVAHFSQFFQSTTINRPRIPNIGFKRISAADSVWLERDVTDEEIWQSVCECGVDKTPGPDGFSFRFILKAWDIIGGDFKILIRSFFSSRQMARGTNSSFLTLIAKHKSPRTFADFRPISLVSCFYKLISKILASRLKRVVDGLIGDCQHGFRSGHQTLDCVMTANEVTHFLKFKKKQGCLFKLDFEKAYDSVEWSYLDDVLYHMGFGLKWREWISQCISTNRVSVLINGSPTTEFAVGRGLRQGCSMSPYLFNLAAEGLNLLICRGKQVGLIQGIGDAENGWEVSHLQFADDTMIFTPWDANIIANTKGILKWFEAFSGLKVNYHKSSLVCVNVPDQESESMAQVLGCKTEALPFPYLGSYVGLNPRRLASWNFLLQKMSTKLATWKGHLLSVGGRITLIKSALCSMTVYNMSIFRMPLGIVRACEKLMRRFLWSGKDGIDGFAKAKWEDVIKPLTSGGLGIGCLQSRNESFMLKWVWELVNGSEKLWARIIRCRYSIHSLGDIWRRPLSAKSSPIWADIFRVCGRQSHLFGFIMENMSLGLGNGQSVSFWWERWAGPSPLALSFPSLYKIAARRRGSVAEHGCVRPTGWHWQLRWKRRLSTVERGEVQVLLGVCGTPVFSEQRHSYSWIPDSSGRFSIKSCSHGIYSSRNTLQPNELLSSCWNRHIPFRICFFSWLCLRNNLSTKAVLLQRHVIAADQATCIFCPDTLEDRSHLFVTCSVAQQVWVRLMQWRQMTWVPAGSLLGLWHLWPSLSGTHNPVTDSWWRQLRVVVLWNLWLHRNNALFRGGAMDIDQLLHKIFIHWHEWIRLQDPHFPYSVTDIQRSADWFTCWSSMARPHPPPRLVPPGVVAG